MRIAVSRDRGYAMAALLVAMAVMSIMMSAALPVWQTAARREREAELVFRGQQYVQAIDLFSRRTGGFPTSLDALEASHFLRKRYKDPVTGDDFELVYLGQVAAATPGAPAQGGRAAGAGPQSQAAAPGGQRAGQPATPFGRGLQPSLLAGQAGAQGAGPIVGVVSKSTEEGLRRVNGRGRYNEWLFVSTATTQQPGAGIGGAGQPPGRGGQGAGQPPGRGGRGAAPIGRGQAPGQLPLPGQFPPRGTGGGLTLPQMPGPRGRGPGQ